jgi:serine/threonine protein kinase/tetratricopeptide (TPR) repeat protein
MGTVFLAFDTLLNRQVALKVLNETGIPGDDRKGRFLREAQAAAQIRHPNVATIYEVGESAEGRPFIAMEFCEGLPLSQVIRQEPIDAARFVKIAGQIALGLAAAHRNGVTHRDIKSANIMLESGDSVKILDFGLAKMDEVASDAATHTSPSGGFFGTLPYLSPEQARGEAADQKSDLFSLGVVFYEMATGVLPFDGETALSLLERIRSAEPREFVPIDPQFPRAGIEIISALLQKRAVDRPPSAEAVVHLLADLEVSYYETSKLSRSMATTTGLRGTTRPTIPIVRNAILYVLAIAVLVLLGILLFREPRKAAPPRSDGTPPPPMRSLAVLPFQNLSQQESEEFLSVGLADALTTQLQQVQPLSVRPTSAVLQFHRKNADISEAASQLQVDGILEGRFLTAGNTVRVSLQLTDARTGYGVWAANLEGSRDNLIDLIDDVASTTRSAIQEKLSTTQPAGRSEPRTSNPKAYELYLRARSLKGSLIAGENKAEIDYLKEAIELDPAFAAAYADLAIALSLGQVRGFSADPEQYNRAEWYARQAVRLDPNLADAHLALGRTLIRFPDRFREGIRETLAALRLNPNETLALHALIAYMTSTGDMQRTNCLLDRFVATNPTSSDVRSRGYFFVNVIDPDEIMRLAPEALAHKETQIAGHDMLSIAHLLRGDPANALIEANKTLELAPNLYHGKTMQMLIAADKGDRFAVNRWAESLRAEAETNHYAAIRIALAYARLGDRDNAIKWLKVAQSLGNHGWYFLVRYPWMQPLQTDPEFQAIVSAMKADLDDVRDDVVGVFELLCPGAKR